MAVARDLMHPVLGGDDIVQLAEERLKTFSSRNQWYATLEGYYYGPEAPTNFGPQIKPMNSQGRPMLRDGELGGWTDKPRRFSSRRLAGVVDDYAALKGRMPISRSEPRTPDDEGQQKSELLTKYLYSTYELSRLQLQQPDAGRHLTLLGDVVYLLEPGVGGDYEGRVLWNVIHPATAYPSFYRGYQRTDMYDLAIIEIWTAKDIRLAFGIDIRDNAPDEDRRVVTYMSPFQRTVVVGTERWKIPARGGHVEWNLGFCPAQWVFNKPGGQMGMSDIGNALDQQDLIDHALNVLADGIVFMTYKQPWIKDPANAQEGMVVGPGAQPLILGPNGAAGMLETGGNPQAIQALVSETIGEMNASTGSSQVRQEGEMHGSIVTGRAIQATQGPQSTRIEAFQEAFAAAWRELNAKTLKMQEKAPVLKDWSGDIFGHYKGQPFNEQMAAKDIDGWYRTTVVWEAFIGMNPAQKVQVAAEGKQFKLWDTPYAMEMVGVEDPQAMYKRVLNEQQTEMQMAAGAAGGAAQGGGPGGGTPQQWNFRPPPGIKAYGGPEPITPGPAQSPTMLIRPDNLGQQPNALPTGVPVGVSRKAVAAALVTVAGKLKGAVYAVGELAQAGQSQTPQLIITASSDHRKVVEAVRSLGNVKVKYAATPPPGAVKVG